jgi:hypothetical protein
VLAWSYTVEPAGPASFGYPRLIGYNKWDLHSKASQEVVIIEFGSKEAPQEDAQKKAQEAP